MTGINTKPENSGDIVKTLKSELSVAGFVQPHLGWEPFSGGRTNRIWHIGTGADALVCKLFDANGGTVLFPNDITAESASLRALSSTGLAPKFVAEFKSSFGPCLIYRFAAGQPWHGDVSSVAKTLEFLHQYPAPENLRRISGGPDEIIRLGKMILAGCCSDHVARLYAKRPATPQITMADDVFLHGDLVPGNIICGPDGNVLIDWQCPATGDPCEDISTFLSPAMQTLYGHRPLSAAERSDFLTAYADPLTNDRFCELKPLFHWRMAAHCLWKFEKGHADYLRAMELELTALDQC